MGVFWPLLAVATPCVILTEKEKDLGCSLGFPGDQGC